MKDRKRGFFYSLFRGLNLIRLIILNIIFLFCSSYLLQRSINITTARTNLKTPVLRFMQIPFY